LKRQCPGYRDTKVGGSLTKQTVFVGRGSDASQRSPPLDGFVNHLEDSYFRSRSLSSNDELENQSDTSGGRLTPYWNATPSISPIPSPAIDRADSGVLYALSSMDNMKLLYRNGDFDFLPGMLSAAGRDSYLYSAARSVGAIDQANRSLDDGLLSMAEFEYAKAVSQVTAALADPDLWWRDETLVAVWLLGVREVRLQNRSKSW
jgi:hypothetical protein